MPGLMESRARTVAPPLAELWAAQAADAVLSLSWSASDRWLALACADGLVLVLDGETGHEVRRWKAHGPGAIRVLWHEWDDLLASSGQDGTVKLWRVDREEPEAALACGKGWVEHIAWSPSGKLLAAACGRRLTLWSKQGKLLREFEEQPNTLAGIAWGRDSTRLISACYGQVVFWSPDSAEARRTLLWKGSMLSLALSPDGRYLCHGNQDSTVHFWIVATGKELQMSGYPMKVEQLSWDNKSRFLATGGSSVVTVWDCSGKGPSGSRPTELDYHPMPLSALRFQREGGWLASGCIGGEVAIWWPGKGETPMAVGRLSSPVLDLAWSCDGKRVAASGERGDVRVWNAA